MPGCIEKYHYDVWQKWTWTITIGKNIYGSIGLNCSCEIKDKINTWYGTQEEKK